MTIYESLGIENILLDVDIPKETILENIAANLYYEAKSCFEVVNGIKLRASINRENHYLQIIEINLNEPIHIERLSYILQKAIKYRVLFLFVFRKRYLFTWRNFNITTSTDNVYTQHITYCSDWIYEESLNGEILYYCNFSDVINEDEEEFYVKQSRIKTTENDNGDCVYFLDIFNNVIKLNNCISDSEWISVRFLVDWLNTHAVGQRVNLHDIVAESYEKEAYAYIENHIFFDKGMIANIIVDEENSKFSLEINHTGKNPMKYFDNCKSFSTFYDEERVISSLSYKRNDTNNSVYEDEFENAQYGGLLPIESYSSKTTWFIDDIYRRWNLRGHLIIEEQEVRVEIIRKLRRKGYQFFEQLKNETFDNLPLNPSEKIETLRFLDKNGMRTQDSSVEEYPDLDDFFAKTIFCEECGLPVQDFSYDREKVLCESCKERKVRLLSVRDFILEIKRINTTNEFVSYDFTSDLELTCFRDEYQRLKFAFALIEFNDGSKKTYEELDRENCIEDEEKRTFDLQLNQNVQFRIRWKLYVSSEELKNIRFLTYYFIDDNNKSYEFVYKLKYSSGLVGNYSIEEYDYLIKDIETNHFDEGKYKTIGSLDIEDFDLSVRAYNCLKRANIHNMVDLLKKTVDEILLIRNLGRKCVVEILQKLDEQGLRVKNFSKEEYPDIGIGVDTIVREKHMKEATKLKVAVCKPEYMSYTNGRTGFTLYINLINQHTAPFKLKLKECAILKNDRQYVSDYNYSGYVFDEGYVFPDTKKTIGKIWVTEAWESSSLKDGDMFTISLIDVGQANELFYKYIYRNEEWVFYDYYEIEE